MQVWVWGNIFFYSFAAAKIEIVRICKIIIYWIEHIIVYNISDRHEKYLQNFIYFIHKTPSAYNITLIHTWNI